MDDIDELLDEVERDLVEKDETRVSIKKKTTPKKMVPNTAASSDIDDWDVDDILADIGDHSRDHKASQSSNKALQNRFTRVPIPSNGGSLKCFPIYLGGTKIVRGFSDGCRKKACDKLRCTSCDFEVHSFRDSTWNRNVDYLFFRNTMPDETKLQARLIKSKGTVAYCCQCSWKSVSDIAAVSMCKDLKWVCGRH